MSKGVFPLKLYTKPCTKIYSFVYDQLPPPFWQKFISLQLNRHQLYIVIVANAYGCTQGLFWLSGRTGTTPPFQRLVEVSFLPLFAYAYAYAYVIDLQQLIKRDPSPSIVFNILYSVHSYITFVSCSLNVEATLKVGQPRRLQGQHYPIQLPRSYFSQFHLLRYFECHLAYAESLFNTPMQSWLGSRL